MEKKIIGFAGRKRAGKGCLCQYLVERNGATVITIADALKNLCRIILDIPSIEKLNQHKDFNTGFRYDYDFDLNRWTVIIAGALYSDGDSDEVKSQKFNAVKERMKKFGTQRMFTVRDMLQFIGTDIIREINPNWHVEKMVEAINNTDAEFVCIDDVRFPNERQAIEQLGGTVFYIIRPDLTVDVSNHISETSLSWYDFNPNRVLINYLDIVTLATNFQEYLDCDFNFSGSIPILMSGAHQFDDENPRVGILSDNITTEEKEFINKYIVKNLGTNGALTIHTKDMETATKLNHMLYKHPKLLEIGYHTFTVWNPYIIENLKRWLLN